MRTAPACSNSFVVVIVVTVTIGANILALGAQRRLNKAAEGVSSAFERLSSGLRINRASDDAAGLAVASSLNVDRRVFDQGLRNLNDGISVLSIADAALETVSDIVVRIRELAEQAANGSYSAKQRKALDAEAQQLSQEFLRVTQSTSFNGISLLNGSTSGIRLQSGYGVSGGLNGSVGGAIGTGTFASGVTYGMDNRITSHVLIADLNNDGKADMITSGQSSAITGSLTIRLGNGDGTFAASFSYANVTATNASDIAFGDFNRDGVLDLAVAEYTGAVNVMIGTGSGTFASAGTFSAESTRTTSIAVADLNGDGIDDIATSGVSGGVGYMGVRLGAGNGTFGARVSYAMNSASASEIEFADVNGDGTLDVVSAGQSGTSSVVTRLGRGDGTFGSTITTALAGVGVGDPNLADLNNDGRIDVAISNNGSVSIGLGQGDGTFTFSVSYNASATYVNDVDLADLNGDGFLDLMSSSDNGGSAANLTVRLGQGNGTFGASRSYATTNYGFDSTTGDLNNDGVLDIVAASQSTAPTGYGFVFLQSTTPGAAPLLPFSLTTSVGARQAMGMLDRKLSILAEQRGQIGAFQSRIDTASRALESSSINYARAEAAITDTDVAETAASLARSQILTQAAASVLAQANQAPALALKLLQG